MNAIQAGLERDQRSIIGQSIPSIRAKQALSRAPAAPRRFFAASQALSEPGDESAPGRRPGGQDFRGQVRAGAPEPKQRYASQKMDPVPSAPGELFARLKSEIEKWRLVARAARIPQQQGKRT